MCIGEQEDGFFRPVVYLLTKDGVVEYVDVLRCLMFGDAMICQDPIYFCLLYTSNIDDTDRVKDYLGKTLASSNHLLSLINDVLDLSLIHI